MRSANHTAQAHFAAAAGLSDKEDGETSASSEQLGELCEVVASAIYSRRAAHALEASQRVVNDIFPEIVAKALESRARQDLSAAQDADDAADSLARISSESERLGSNRISTPSSVEPQEAASRRGSLYRRQSIGDGLIVSPRDSESHLMAEAFPSVTIIFAGATVVALRTMLQCLLC